VPWPPQGLYTKKEINALSDLKGIKFRTYSPTTSRFAELVGAIPTTIQVPDIPQAFRTGLVDAMITSGATGVDSQAWDYLSYYYDTQAFLPQNMVIVNKGAFAKLDAATRNAVHEAAKAAEARGWKTSESENAGYVKTMGEHGIKIMKPPAKLSSEFEAIGKQMADEWSKKAGAEGEAILKAYRGK
jgi:TRAP-type C4-dicarboxylate transport system substrate-binding protein